MRRIKQAVPLVRPRRPPGRMAALCQQSPQRTTVLRLAVTALPGASSERALRAAACGPTANWMRAACTAAARSPKGRSGARRSGSMSAPLAATCRRPKQSGALRGCRAKCVDMHGCCPAASSTYLSGRRSLERVWRNSSAGPLMGPWVHGCGMRALRKRRSFHSPFRLSLHAVVGPSCPGIGLQPGHDALLRQLVVASAVWLSLCRARECAGATASTWTRAARRGRPRASATQTQGTCASRAAEHAGAALLYEGVLGHW